MKNHLIFPLLILVQLAFFTPVQAGSFGWIESLTVEAKTDLSSFRVRLKTRFRIGDVEVKTVLSKTREYGDAYMVLRLSEMSGQRVDVVLDRYHRHRKKGWGVLAKSLGIKPGSRAFHALKRGHDMGPRGGSRHQGRGGDSHPGGPGRGRGRGRGRGKH